MNDAEVSLSGLNHRYAPVRVAYGFLLDKDNGGRHDERWHIKGACKSRGYLEASPRRLQNILHGNAWEWNVNWIRYLFFRFDDLPRGNHEIWVFIHH